MRATGGVDDINLHQFFYDSTEIFRFISLTQMCPHNNADALPAQKDEMVSVNISTNGHRNRLNGVTPDHPLRNPYAPRASDFLNNISNFKIIESTLRGQFHR